LGINLGGRLIGACRMTQIARLWFVAAMLALALALTRPVTANDWRPLLEADARAGQELGKVLDAAFATGDLENLHAVVVARHGSLLLERYYPGGDGQITADTPHDLRSVTKSIVGLLYGIALAEGHVPTLETPVVTLFPSCADVARDPRRRRITVEHLLTMTAGLASYENQRARGRRNSAPGEEHTADPYCQALGRRIVAKPGSAWIYTDSATALLGHLISRGAGMPLGAYAEEKLFVPLSIANVEWLRDENGEEIAAFGLRMTANDLAKIGQLVLNGGRWSGGQVVPDDWLRESFQERVTAYPSAKYGLHWYLPRRHRWSKGQVTAAGKGGQRLDIFLDLSLVVVINAGNYNRSSRSAVSRKVLQEFVLPIVAN